MFPKIAGEEKIFILVRVPSVLFPFVQFFSGDRLLTPRKVPVCCGLWQAFPVWSGFERESRCFRKTMLRFVAGKVLSSVRKPVYVPFCGRKSFGKCLLFDPVARKCSLLWQVKFWGTHGFWPQKQKCSLLWQVNCVPEIGTSVLASPQEAGKRSLP